MELDLGGGWIVDLVTPPNTLPRASLVVGSECPWGFVIPDDPSKHGIKWLSGTACAFACPFKFGYTNTERETYVKVAQAYGSFAFFLSIACLVNMYLIPHGKRNPFVAIFTVLTTVRNFIFFIWIVPGDGTVCSSNATWLESYDHTSFFGGICGLTSVLLVIQPLLASWAMMTIFMELWFRVVWGVKNDLTFYRYFYVGGGLLVTLAVIIGALVSGPSPGPNAAGNNNVVCFWTSGDWKTDFMTITVPSLAYFAVSLVVAMHGIYVCVKISLAAQGSKEKSPLKKLWKTYRMLFLLIAMFICINVPLLFWYCLYVGYVKVDAYITAATTWIICEVSTFVDSSSPIFEVCGNTPVDRINMWQVWMYHALMFTQIILFFLLTLTPDSRLFWWYFMPPSMRKVFAGTEKTAPSTFAESNMSLSRKSAMSSDNRSSVADKDGDSSDEDAADIESKNIQTISGVGQLVLKDKPLPTILESKHQVQIVRHEEESKDGFPVDIENGNA